jgi:hypothetical protein
MDNDLECPICLKNISNGMFVSHCLHVFCLKCIQKCLLYKKLCPLCRKKLYYRPERRSQNITTQRVLVQSRFERRITYNFYLMKNSETGIRWMENRDSFGILVSSLPFWINSFNI